MIYFNLLGLFFCLVIGIVFLIMGFQKQSDDIKSNSGFDELSLMIVILYGILKLFHVKQTETRWTISAIIVGIILTLSSLGLITYIIITKKAIF